MLLKLKLSQRKPFRKCIYRSSKASYTPKDQGWSSPQGLDWRTTFFLTGEEEKGGSGESKFPSSRMQPSLPLSIWLQRIGKTKAPADSRAYYFPRIEALGVLVSGNRASFSPFDSAYSIRSLTLTHKATSSRTSGMDSP